MKRKKLTLYRARDETLRTVFKNNHGRIIFLALNIDKTICTIKDHYYLDRKKFSSAKKFVTRTFPLTDLIAVIEKELDRKFSELETVSTLFELSTEEFINQKLSEMNCGYRFLIFIGEGELVNGIPTIIKTRFKNRIHRSIYLEMRYKNGRGVITDCRYYDRKYKGRASVTPESLSTVFFDYNRQAIIDIINNELNTAFTNIIFVTDGSLDINNEIALCGNI